MGLGQRSLVRPLFHDSLRTVPGDVVDDTFGLGPPRTVGIPDIVVGPVFLDGHEGVGPVVEASEGEHLDEPSAPAVTPRRSWTDGLTEPELRDLVTTLPVIEQAKGVLMGHYGIDADRAFAVLKRWSSTRHLKLREVCAALVDRVVAAPRPDLDQGLQALLDDIAPD